MYIRYIKGSPKVFEEKVPVLDTWFSEGSTQTVVLDIWLPKSCPWTLLILGISSVQKYSFNKSAWPWHRTGSTGSFVWVDHACQSIIEVGRTCLVDFWKHSQDFVTNTVLQQQLHKNIIWQFLPKLAATCDDAGGSWMDDGRGCIKL